MDNQFLTLKDAALIVLAAATQAANVASAAFDLAQGATLVNGQFAPGAGGAAMNMIIPVTSYNAASTLVIGGSPTGGTFPVTVTNSGGAQTTTALAYNATSATVLAALVALTNVGAGNVTVSLTSSTYTIIFAASLGITTVTSSAASLTGGAPTVTITTPTYAFVVNESPDGATWQPASRVATIATTDAISPGGGVLQVQFTAKFRYVQLALTVTGTAPSIVLADAYVTPFINTFGG